MQALVSSHSDALGAVIHAAGVASYALIPDLTAEILEKTLSPRLGAESSERPKA